MTAPRKRSARRAKRPAAKSARDMEHSSFAPILADLVARVPGAFGAVMVDGDGEAVDYAGAIEPFDLKLAGAHWQIVLAHTCRAFDARADPTGPGHLKSLVVRGERRSFIAHALPEGYAVVLILSRRAGFSAAARAFAVCEHALAREAGWRIRARGAWFPLDIVATRAGRPTRLREGSREHALEVLGRLAGSSSLRNELGWRVRLENGAELTLVREPGGSWYADESLESLFSPRPA